MKTLKNIVNKCDKQGNHITGYEETLTGTKEECERDYRAYYDYDGPIDIEAEERELTDAMMVHTCLECEKSYNKEEFEKLWQEIFQGKEMISTGRFAYICDCGQVISYVR